MSIKVNDRLTSHTPGSVRELLVISFPLILSMLSSNVMNFVDRLILSHYDLMAMNAAMVAGAGASIFQFGAMGIASISEVFVGQCHGANKLHKMGEPVWQMIWFSLFTAFIFIPCGLTTGSYFVTEPEYIQSGIPYYQWQMFFGPMFAFTTALSAFFVGQGRVKFVLMTTILGNLVNIGLDFILIFGVKSVCLPMGAAGAAMATGLAETLQALIMFGVFLNRGHRHLHGTGRWRFRSKLFWQSVYLGLPNFLSSIIEMSAWSALATILISISEVHITVYSIGDSFFSLFSFAFTGLQTGITIVAANYIGANKEDILGKSWQSGMKIIFGAMVLLSIPLFFLSDRLTGLFLDTNASPLFNEEVKSNMSIALRWLWLYFIFDGSSRLMSGILTAAGDTKFIMVMNSLSAWLFAVLPLYIVMHLGGTSPILSWVLFALYGLLNTYGFYIRFKKRRSFGEHALHAFV